MYVDFEDSKAARRLYTSSLKNLRDSNGSTQVSTPMRPPVNVVDVSRVRESSGSQSMNTNVTENSTVQTNGTLRTYRERVLTLYEFVGEVRECHRDNRDLDFKLREVEKMILGLTLSEE